MHSRLPILFIVVLFILCACTSTNRKAPESKSAAHVAQFGAYSPPPFKIDPGVALPLPNGTNYSQIVAILKADGFQVTESPKRVAAKKSFTSKDGGEVVTKWHWIVIDFTPGKRGFSQGGGEEAPDVSDLASAQPSLRPPPTPGPLP